MSATARTMPGEAGDLLLRETNHRCSNDLQMVVALLQLQSARAATPETRAALHDAAERVGILSKARADLTRQSRPDLATALRHICEALTAQAEPRSVSVSLAVNCDPPGLHAEHVMALALSVNELATNALKHAFVERQSGSISISVSTGPTAT